MVKNINILKSIENIENTLHTKNGTPLINIITKQIDGNTFNIEVKADYIKQQIDNKKIEYSKIDNIYTFNLSDLDTLINIIKDYEFRQYGKKYNPLIIDIVDNSYLESALYQKT